MVKRFPYTTLRRAVRDAARAAFAELQHEHPSETFYAFALWTNDLAQSVTAVANSVEGLDRMVARYLSKGHESFDSDGMRWSYGDWEYQSVGEGHFSTVNKLLLSAIADGYSDGDDAASERRLTKLLGAIVGGFQDLDGEDFFGRGEARDGVALLIVGDIDEPFADRCIRKLNPASVAARLLKPKSLPPHCSELGPAARQPTTGLAVSPDGTVLLVATNDSVIGFDLPGFAERKPLRLYKGRTWEYPEYEVFKISDIVFSPDGSEFATSHLHNSYGVVARWSTGKRRPIAVTDRLEWGCNTFAWSPDGTLFAGACRDHVIRLWGVDHFDLRLELTTQRCGSRCLGFFADGRTLISLDGCMEKDGDSLRSWNAATGAIEWEVMDRGWCFRFVPNSDRVAIMSYGDSEPHEIRFRSCRDGALLRRVAVGIRARTMAFSSDGRLMAIGSSFSNPTVELWDMERELRIAAVEMDSYSAHAIQFVDSDRAVAIIAWDRYGHPDPLPKS